MDLPDPSNGPSFPSSISFDALNGAKLGQHDPASTQYGATTTVDSAWGYDLNGRQTARTDTLSGAKTGTVTSSRAYDFNDHLTGGACSPASLCAGGTALSYAWTASGHLALMTGDSTRSGQPGYGAGKSETLHSVGGQPIFTTNANGVLDDLKIGALGDITTLAGTGGGKAGLTIWDRELDGRQSSWHSSAGVGNWYPPGDPTQGYNLNPPDDRGILFVQVARTDGMTDRHNVFQGSRVYDYTLGHWTSSDSAPGSLDDAFSYRRYLYDHGNSLTFGDPSGNDPTSLIYNPAPDPSNTIGGIIGAIIGFFAALFGGHGHSSAPQPPPQEKPEDPSKYTNHPDILAGKSALEIILPALGGLGTFGGISAEAAGLGGEVAGAAGVETVESAFSAIGSTGSVGESALSQLGGESQAYFQTNLGARYVDQLVEGVAHESKVGYQSLTRSNKLQILKDAYLVQTGRLDASVWHFFTSPVTGRGGPSAPLANFLESNRITTIVR